jgi:cystathionine beta-lyase/cystathionine gamma-synthase
MSSDPKPRNPLRFSTLAVHAGVEPDPVYGAIMTPIYQTSTYVQPEIGQPLKPEYDYSRVENPTREALEKSLAALEGGRHGITFASGMAAIDTLMRLVQPGDHVVCGNDVYGGTYRLFAKILSRYGLVFDYVDTTDVDKLAAAVTDRTRLVWLETPSNPLLKLTDIAAAAEIAHRHGAWLGVDNTFATPALQRPLSLGADIVMHSTTKYLGGHSDVVGGALVVNDGEIFEELRFLRKSIGAVPGPMDCFLTLRGIKTLALRLKAHCANAARLAAALAEHPLVEKIYYPGLPGHPNHALVQGQMGGLGGGMVSFIPRGGAEAAKTIALGTRVFSLAESLGGVESLIEVPAAMTHMSVADSLLAVDAGLVRLSVGIEDGDDLLTDLAQALDRVEAGALATAG